MSAPAHPPPPLPPREPGPPHREGLPERPPAIDRSRFRLVLDDVPPKRRLRTRALMVAGWFALCLTTAVGALGFGLYFKFSAGLPDIPKVDEYWPPIVTEVFTDDAVLAG